MDLDDILTIMKGRMKELGMSRADLAKRLGVSRSTVSTFFNRDRRDMSILDMMRYFEVLGLGMEIYVVE